MNVENSNQIMIIKDSLEKKILTVQELKYRINSWLVYDDKSMVLFYSGFSINAANLNKLLEYSALCDKLVLALPKHTPGDKLFEFANLQVIDGIVLYQQAEDVTAKIDSCYLAFEDVALPENFSEEDKKRVLSL